MPPLSIDTLITKNVEISSNGINLSGIINQSEDSIGIGALVLHPHPVYGGDMENRVVLAMVTTLLNCGYTTLRFNFRGTTSTSQDFSGVGGAVNDVKNAVAFLLSGDVSSFGIIGYSFGGSVALRYSTEISPRFLITLSASYGLLSEAGFDTNRLSKIHCPTLMFHGKADSVVPFTDAELIADLIGYKDLERVLLDGEGHFYLRSLDRVSMKIDEFLHKHEF
ncbi:MAG: alpha/beta hydrolase [Promethearchaeota archaeon]